MSTTEEDFKQRLAAVLKDLGEGGVKDSEAMFMMGNLASQMVAKGKAPSWSALKSRLSTEAYQSLLKTMEKQGNALVRDGKGKAAYALQALAVSLVARAQKDPVTLQGDKLLDQLIDAAITQYRKVTS